MRTLGDRLVISQNQCRMEFGKPWHHMPRNYVTGSRRILAFGRQEQVLCTHWPVSRWRPRKHKLFNKGKETFEAMRIPIRVSISGARLLYRSRRSIGEGFLVVWKTVVYGIELLAWYPYPLASKMLKGLQEDNSKVILQYNSSISWEIRFYGNYAFTNLNGVNHSTTVSTLNGRTISSIQTIVEGNQTSIALLPWFHQGIKGHKIETKNYDSMGTVVFCI